MWLGCKEGFEYLLAVMYLTDMTNFCQGDNALAHNYRFLGAVHDLLNCNQLSIPCVNHALVAAHRCGSPMLIKDGPILLNQGNELLGMRRVKVRGIQVFGQLSAMQCLTK
jgi:hypothetical protein